MTRSSSRSQHGADRPQRRLRHFSGNASDPGLRCCPRDGRRREHAFILADEASPVAMAGIFQAATAVIDGRTRVAERFRSGEGVGWHEHHDGLFSGTERSFGANYRVHLVSEWLPALTGIVEETGTRRRRRRRRLRPRRVDDPHGAGLPGLDVHRHRRPPRVDRGGPRARRTRASRTACGSRWRTPPTA